MHDWVARNIAHDQERWTNREHLRSLGVPTRVAEGMAKGAAGWERHSWAEALAGDRWVTMDTTWNAGTVRAGTFTFQYSTRWFDPAPDIFRQDHVFAKYQ